ncbi:MAG TPA: FGGY-family carbohydrate kinase [Negativicutes bacterium]|nr:FGGY-family carbohydrate kinase [Negativicutes bacterium]
MKYSLSADTERYFHVESSATSAVNLSWFMEKVIRCFAPESMGEDELHQIIEARLAAKDPWTVHITYMPFIYKSHLSAMDGAFVGLKPEHDLFDMLLGIYEGVVFAHRKHIENLKNGGVSRRSAVLTGGASRSPLWNQLFADVLNMEVATTEASEAGALVRLSAPR